MPYSTADHRTARGDETAECADNCVAPVTVADVHSALHEFPPDPKLGFLHWVAARFGVPAAARSSIWAAAQAGSFPVSPRSDGG